jgi:hypothetical protein
MSGSAQWRVRNQRLGTVTLVVAFAFQAQTALWNVTVLLAWFFLVSVRHARAMVDAHSRLLVVAYISLHSSTNYPTGMLPADWTLQPSPYQLRS